MNANEIAKVYETLLCTPGMNDVIKIDLKVDRKTVLLLHNVIELGLAVKEDDQAGGIMEQLPPETKAELQKVAEECLQKAGLKELSERIKSLTAK